ncbi:DUF1648 domain-containing protein [Thermoflexibacter ruber]|uniref:DUF1648 domain-containing protein n=1 Tax=Thermoflexibacter ruber TaxID=1003 RepID=A0A1I2EBW0_9BACT|nr:DUF1648 domain-containing protein [Thermoflexibacter ruber]SFE90355.1 Protein of unknown function [Thermoflexibacter ruber]
MKTKPKIELELSPIDQFWEIAGWVALVLLIGLAILSYFQLPETIPTHFNFKGEADDFGRKETIFILPALGAIVFIGMTILNRYPHIFNYSVEITKENAQRQYTLATRLIRYLKFSVLLVFAIITFVTFKVATGALTEIGTWSILVVIFLLVFPSIFFALKLKKSK